MDLERCPKCGNRWVAGYERCMECGFVPIGAGLKNAPKKKKKKAGKYVEPGSSRGFLLTCLLGLLAWGTYHYKPWEDDWELVRAMFGKGRRHSIVGDWKVTRTRTLSKDKPGVLSQPGLKPGLMQFSKQGSVKMIFSAAGAKTVASGQYVVDGQRLAMNGVKSPSSTFGLPKHLQMSLGWNGPDEVVAMLGTEAVWLSRTNKKGGIMDLMKLGLSKGKKGEVPGELKNVFGKMGEQLDAATDTKGN
jgi:hypothetical protein